MNSENLLCTIPFLLSTAPNVVLTAAHCLDGAESVEVTAGAHNIREEEPTQQIQTTTNLIVHERYSSLFINNDVALAILETPFEINGERIWFEV